MKRYASIPAALPCAALLLASLVFLAACKMPERAAAPPAPRPAKANNLKFVDCYRHISGNAGVVEIAVNPLDGIAQVDEFVAVCAGERVHWKASAAADAQGNRVRSFEIKFASGEWPFQSAQQALVPAGEAATPDQEPVKVPDGVRHKAYKYTIVVTLTNKATITLDPYVIPMGS
ncbi:MAG: hypothetical protein LAN84_16285 [Acidobacteriia bacterium]|nr:hypothetical protein [Terriglobia bacterium]